MKCFTLHAMNLKYMKVSVFEISYKKKWTFSQHSNLLRCTCKGMQHCMAMQTSIRTPPCGQMLQFTNMLLKWEGSVFFFFYFVFDLFFLSFFSWYDRKVHHWKRIMAWPLRQEKSKKMRRKTAIGIFCPVRRLISKAFFILLLRLFLGVAVSGIQFSAIHSIQLF